MACPYFFATHCCVETPTRPMPLGDFYQGECRARAEAYLPDESRLKKLCNLGYARNACPRFPQDAGPDAVRFSVAREKEDQFLIRYVQERDHLPWEHGSLSYCVSERGFLKPHANPILNRLAEAYAEAYLRRRQLLTLHS